MSTTWQPSQAPPLRHLKKMKGAWKKEIVGTISSLGFASIMDLTSPFICISFILNVDLLEVRSGWLCFLLFSQVITLIHALVHHSVRSNLQNLVNLWAWEACDSVPISSQIKRIGGAYHDLWPWLYPMLCEMVDRSNQLTYTCGPSACARVSYCRLCSRWFAHSKVQCVKFA